MEKGYKDFLAEAESVVKTYDFAESQAFLDDESVVFVDVRDGNEIDELGKIAGAVRASRGMLEFLIDPSSPFHEGTFALEKEFVFYCGSGRRSVLAAHRAMEMGLKNVAHLKDGFKGWVKSGGPIVNE